MGFVPTILPSLEINTQFRNFWTERFPWSCRSNRFINVRPSNVTDSSTQYYSPYSPEAFSVFKRRVLITRQYTLGRAIRKPRANIRTWNYNVIPSAGMDTFLRVHFENMAAISKFVRSDWWLLLIERNHPWGSSGSRLLDFRKSNNRR